MIANLGSKKEVGAVRTLLVVVLVVGLGAAGLAWADDPSAAPAATRTESAVQYDSDFSWMSNIFRSGPAKETSDSVITPMLDIGYTSTRGRGGLAPRTEFYLRARSPQFLSNSEQSSMKTTFGAGLRSRLGSKSRADWMLAYDINRSIHDRDNNIYTGNTNHTALHYGVDFRRLAPRNWVSFAWEGEKSNYTDVAYDTRDATVNDYSLTYWSRSSPTIDSKIYYRATRYDVEDAAYNRWLHRIGFAWDTRAGKDATWSFSAFVRRALFDDFGGFARRDTHLEFALKYDREGKTGSTTRFSLSYLTNNSNDKRTVVDFADYRDFVVGVRFGRRT